MKLGTMFSKVADILKYLRMRRKRKLYKQWVEMAELPPEELPQEEVAPRLVHEEDGPDEAPLRLNTLYLMQGASLVLLCVILIILIVQSC